MTRPQPEFEPIAVLKSFKGTNSSRGLSFTNPVEILTVRRLEDVERAIRLVEQETKARRWAVVMLAYEAGPAFDRACEAHALDDFPLAWVAIFDAPCDFQNEPTRKEYRTTRWEPQISRQAYRNAI